MPIVSVPQEDIKNVGDHEFRKHHQPTSRFYFHRSNMKKLIKGSLWLHFECLSGSHDNNLLNFKKANEISLNVALQSKQTVWLCL